MTTAQITEFGVALLVGYTIVGPTMEKIIKWRKQR